LLITYQRQVVWGVRWSRRGGPLASLLETEPG